MIKFLKLVSGNNVVSEVEDFGNSVYLKWPMELTDNADAAEGEPKVRIDPFAAHVRGHCVKIDKTAILFAGEPVPTLRDYYEKTFGSMIPPTIMADGEPSVGDVDYSKVSIPVAENADGELTVTAEK